MSNIVNLQEHKEASSPHMSGEAVCFNCKHQWQAVAPVGVLELECPSCGTLRGVWNHTVWPSEQEVWMCNCGAYHFALTKQAAHCLACGCTQVF